MKYDRQEVLDRFDTCKSHYSDLYDNCEQDWKFLHGEGQWEERAEKVRDISGRPCLTLNQLLPYAQQVVNDIRQARMAIRVSPVDDSGDVDTAEVLSGVIRNIERQSNADTAYTTAALYAVGSGIGWIKVKTDYADIDTFDQEAYIERVLDFRSVYPEPNFQELDGSDIDYAFILDGLTKERYEELYPDRDPLSFTDGSSSSEDLIYIAEYYTKHYENDKLYQVRLIDGSVQTINGEEKAALDDGGTVVYEIMTERDIQIPYVKKCILDGHEDPIDETDFPSQYIPVIPVFGSEVFIDGRREFHSLIRQAKEFQRIFNYYNSSDVEVVALQPKTPFVGAKGSFKSFPNKWATANNENYSTLEYDIVHDDNGMRVEPPQRQPTPQASPAMAQGAMMAREGMRLALGMPNANMGERGNEVSGVAIRNRQVEGDNATFHFIDNLAASISQVGRILVDIIPQIYNERKILRIIGDDGVEKTVPVNVPIVKQDGQVRPARQGENAQGIYNIGMGKYDVVCDVGASYSSKRQETADKLIELVRAKPEIAEVTADLLFEALDLPMGKEIAKRIKSTMDPALLEEDPMASKLQQASQALKQLEEQVMNYQAALDAKQENTQFDQNVELKKLEQESQKLKIEADKTAADIQKTMAEIEKMRAETTGFNMEAVTALGNAVQGMSMQVQDIGEAMEIILDAKEAEQGEEVNPIENNIDPGVAPNE